MTTKNETNKGAKVVYILGDDEITKEEMPDKDDDTFVIY